MQHHQLILTPFWKGQAIFNLLTEYNWYEFSILASADTYGINGMVYLQYLATRESMFSITDVQHFDTTLADSNIGRSLIKVRPERIRIGQVFCT